MGAWVLPSLLVKLKYVNDLLAEGRCSGPGQERAIFTWGWAGQCLYTQGEDLLYYVLMFSIWLFTPARLSLIPLTALWTNQFILSVSKQKPYQLGHWLFIYINSVFTLSNIVTHNFLDPSESLIYFQFKLLKSFKVFLKQNINTFYLKD